MAILGKPESMHDVGLHRVEERLDVRIVGHFAGTVHALRDAQVGQSLLERSGGVLDASIRMKDQASLGPADAHRAVQRREGGGLRATSFRLP